MWFSYIGYMKNRFLSKNNAKTEKIITEKKSDIFINAESDGFFHHFFSIFRKLLKINDITFFKCSGYVKLLIFNISLTVFNKILTEIDFEIYAICQKTHGR